jgi:hypothetical protein
MGGGGGGEGASITINSIAIQFLSRAKFWQSCHIVTCRLRHPILLSKEDGLKYRQTLMRGV